MQVEEYFRGKGCVVTGAASGIGFAVSEALLQAGADVVLADRDVERLAAAVERLGDHGERVQSAVVDVTNQGQVQRLIEDAASSHGGLDCLFNNAGIGLTQPIGEATLEHWRRIVDLNLWSVIYGTHAALPLMRRQGGGHIINTASVAGLVPLPYQALYSTTKYGVVGLSECLRYELADEGIHVSVVCPGAVVSRIWGTSIAGGYSEVKPPEDAIPAEEAAQIILAGVANKEGIIAFPEQVRSLWRYYWSSPEAAEGELRDLARQRRSAYESEGAAEPTEVFRPYRPGGHAEED
jgi:NAD(P)-dependent dehydrogenase (short-subunit alcohol dehydrogenase family)